MVDDGRVERLPSANGSVVDDGRVIRLPLTTTLPPIDETATVLNAERDTRLRSDSLDSSRDGDDLVERLPSLDSSMVDNGRVERIPFSGGAGLSCSTSAHAELQNVHVGLDSKSPRSSDTSLYERLKPVVAASNGTLSDVPPDVGARTRRLSVDSNSPRCSDTSLFECIQSVIAASNGTLPDILPDVGARVRRLSGTLVAPKSLGLKMRRPSDDGPILDSQSAKSQESVV
jgi:hypothetical protein